MVGGGKMRTVPSCRRAGGGKEWWARQGKETPTKPGWAEPRTTARSWCSVSNPGHHAEQGTWGSRTRKHREAGCGRPEDGGVWTAKIVKRPPQQPAQPQYTNHWAPLTRKRHPLPLQHSPSTPTTGLHERGDDTSRSTGRSGRQNAATRRNMRREERVTVQGPVKKQQPDGMSHRGVWGGGVHT